MNLLEWLMTPPYSPGQEVRAAQTRFGKIGVLICADTHVEDVLQRMADLRPDLVLVPYGYAAQESAWPEHGKELERVVTHAAEVIGAPVVGTNLIGQITHGPWTGWTYGGHSVAADQNRQAHRRRPGFRQGHPADRLELSGITGPLRRM